jgi:hypothetical protein
MSVCFSGVVVLSSTDCSSCSSSGCSGHSDITEPGSPYSSPGPGGASPEPGSGEESEDPRPPDPGAWPFVDEDSNSKCPRKRPYPWKGVIASSTPKRMRIEEQEAEEAAIAAASAAATPSSNNNSSCTANSNNPPSPAQQPPQQQQQQSIAVRKTRPQQQKQWPLAAAKLLDAKGQIKITEYFKTQAKAKNGFKKELDIKLFPAQVIEGFGFFSLFCLS